MSSEYFMLSPRFVIAEHALSYPEHALSYQNTAWNI